MQERCKLAFKDVHTKSGRQHASEEQVTLADRYVTLTANQYCYKRRPIEPDDRIEEVKCQATQVNTQARRSLHIAEVYLVCLACLGSVAGFKEHRIKAETGHNACANVNNPTIVEQQDHLLHRYVSGYEKQCRDNEYIAGANTKGKGDSVTEAVMYTCLYLREECRAKAEKQRQRNASKYA